jgi:hypothetical protein
MSAALLMALALLALPSNPQNPWPPSYRMRDSTFINPCNFSGYYDYGAFPALADFGLVSYDWATAKEVWARHKPMTNQGSMVEQARRTKQHNPNAKVLVYRNLVKALPWFEEVREKLEDPAYWGWFLRLKPELRHGTTATGNLFHDFKQTPGKGDHRTSPRLDGWCGSSPTDPSGCDCGSGVECGEYLWNHSNASLSHWLISTYLNGSRFGLGNEAIDGFFLDDQWVNSSGNTPGQMPGPSEESSPMDACGMSNASVDEMTAAWNRNLVKAQAAIVANDGVYWGGHRSMLGFVSPVPDSNSSVCSTYLRKACAPDSLLQTGSHLHLLAVNVTRMPAPWQQEPASVLHDLASFLLVRGPWAWLGYNWAYCGCGGAPGPGPQPGLGARFPWRMDCGGYPRPASLDVDYGEPTGLCAETSAGSGVFQRSWTKATVAMDCNTGTPSITLKTDDISRAMAAEQDLRTRLAGPGSA